jgi:hypothetical protein
MVDIVHFLIKSRRIRWAWYVTRMGDLRERDHLEDLRGGGREDNIKTNFQEVEWEGMDWTDLAQYRDRRRALVNAVTNFRLHSNAWNFLTS